MAKTISGTHILFRLSHFKWLYILLAVFLWSAFISLVIVEKDPYGYWADVFTLLRSTEDVYNPTKLNTHGVYGFYYQDNYYFQPKLGDYLSQRNIAAAVLIASLISFVTAFSIPERGKAKRLTSRQPQPLRIRLSVALIFGFFATACLAGVNDVLDFNSPLSEIRRRFMWLQIGSTESIEHFYYSAGFAPDEGIARPITWLFFIVGIGAFTFLFLKLEHLVRLDHERYWQSVRYTSIFTWLGLGLILLGLWGIRIDEYWSHYAYYDIEHFAGGCYTSFVIGLFVLTWAITCRAVLLSSVKAYKRAEEQSEAIFCSVCGYDLRMLVSDRCPECGSPVHPEMMVKIRKLAETQAESRSTTR